MACSSSNSTSRFFSSASRSWLALVDEKKELQTSMELFEKSDYSAFYESNQNIVQSVLFLETLEEFLDFSKGNSLDKECYCAAFLCAHGYGIQIGGKAG